MAKVQKSLRIDSEIVERITPLKAEGESEAALYNRVLKAGLDSLKGNQETPQEQQAEASAYEKELLEANIKDLRGNIDLLKEQIALKDKQIEALTTLANNAQIVSGIASTTSAKALEANNKKPTFKERIGRWFGYKAEQETEHESE